MPGTPLIHMSSIKVYIPNTITCLNLLSGAVAIWCSFQTFGSAGGLTPRQWAFAAIAAAAVFDFLDGFSARLLGAYSDMGKELDSLSDLVSFGLAPAFLVMNMMAEQGTSSGLTLLGLLIAVAGALRLAKFNVDTRQSTSFIGLPIPANALFWIGALSWMDSHSYIGLWAMVALIVIFSWLMVSEIPMFSLKFKTYGWRENVRRYALIIAAVLFVATSGVAGLAWTIIFYILLSVLSRRDGAVNA